MQLELYRDTRESILLATQQPNCLCVGWGGMVRDPFVRTFAARGGCKPVDEGRRECRHVAGEMRCVTGLHKAAATCAVCRRDMSTAARDRAFKAEMRAEGNLHPALQTPDGHYKVRESSGRGQLYCASAGALQMLAVLGAQDSLLPLLP